MADTLEGQSLKEKLLAGFHIRKAALLPDNTILNGFRDKAAESFSRLGFPGKKHEEYRYLQVEKLFTSELNQTLSPEEIDLPNESDVLNYPLLAEDAYRLVMLNGIFSKKLSRIEGLPTGVVMGSLAEALRNNDAHALTNLGTLAKADSDSFLALNSALFQDGIYCYIPSNCKLPKPVQLIELVSSPEALLIQPRVLFVSDESSEAEVIQTSISTKGNTSIASNSVTEILVEKNAQVNWITLQSEEHTAGHFHTTEAHVKQHGKFETVTISLGSGMLRNNLNIVLDAPECEAHLYGYYHPVNTQIVDNHTLVDHRYPRCESNEMYKGVVDDSATAIFNGKVYVRKDAQKTNAFQSNKNILLSETGTVNTKPQLEIYADDVKCSHGSSTGVLDPEQLFYLRARGISLEKARVLLLNAYAGEIIEHIPHETLRNAVAEVLANRI